EVVDHDEAAELLAGCHEALHLGALLRAEGLSDLESDGLRCDAVALQARGHLLQEAVVLERGNRDIQREAAGLHRPGRPMAAEPGEQSLYRQQIEDGRIPQLPRRTRGEYLEAAQPSAGAQ